MKTLIATGVLFLFVTSSFCQTIRRVGIADGSPYATIADAVTASNPGDTLYIAGATAGYSGATINKRLVLIGPGYFLGLNPETSVNKNQARMTGNITITADTVVIMGLHFENYSVILNAGVENVVIMRNYFSGSTTYGAVTLNNTSPVGGVNNNITIKQNFFGVNNLYVAIGQNYTATNSNVLILNNYFSGKIDELTGTGMTIKNNVFMLGTNNSIFTAVVSNSSIQNNIINFTGASPVTNIDVGTTGFTNNICNGTVFGTANANQESVDLSTVFIVDPATADPAPYSTDSRWQLAAGSPAIGAGASGEDIGMYGGLEPYQLSGLPPLPTIFEISVPSSGTQTGGLNITIKAKVKQ